MSHERTVSLAAHGECRAMAAAAAAALLASVENSRTSRASFGYEAPTSGGHAAGNGHLGGSYSSSTQYGFGQSGAAPESVHAGVGILLHHDSESRAVHVKTCVKGGAAQRDGRILPGDMIIAVADQNTQGLGVDEVRALVGGPQGTLVKIQFERVTTGATFECCLLRGTPDFLEARVRGSSSQPSSLQNSLTNASLPASLSSLNRSLSNHSAEGLRRSALGGEGAAGADAVFNSFTSAASQHPPHTNSAGLAGSYSSTSIYREGGRSLSGSLNGAVQGGGSSGGAFSLEEEVRRLRNRVSELEAENRSTKDELNRTRVLVDNERESALHYVKEMDQMQRKYTDHIGELQHMLQHNEGLRRETEAQLQVHVRKGDELGDLIRQGQEQVDARELYFSELCVSYEQKLAQFAQQAQLDREQCERAEEARKLAESSLEKLTYELHRIRAADKTRREMEEKLKAQVLESSRRLHELQETEDKTRTKTHQTLKTLHAWHQEYFANAPSSNQDAEQYFLA